MSLCTTAPGLREPFFSYLPQSWAGRRPQPREREPGVSSPASQPSVPWGSPHPEQLAGPGATPGPYQPALSSTLLAQSRRGMTSEDELALGGEFRQNSWPLSFGVGSRKEQVSSHASCPGACLHAAAHFSEHFWVPRDGQEPGLTHQEDAELQTAGRR